MEIDATPHASDDESEIERALQKNVVPALVKEFGYKNVMAVPKIEKISINIGMGEATANSEADRRRGCRNWRRSPVRSR